MKIGFTIAFHNIFMSEMRSPTSISWFSYHYCATIWTSIRMHNTKLFIEIINANKPFVIFIDSVLIQNISHYLFLLIIGPNGTLR